MVEFKYKHVVKLFNIIHVKNTLETINVKESTIDTLVSRLTAGSVKDNSEDSVTVGADELVGCLAA